MKSEIIIKDSIDLAADFLANHILDLSKEKKEIFIAISGGNTPKVLFKLLADKYINAINWNSIHFYWVDERCVPPNQDESNYYVVNNLLFSNIAGISSRIERIFGENDPCEEVKRYQNILYSQLPTKNKQPVFDLVLLGMGDDGHTASIFPHQLDLMDSKNLCEIGEHPTSGQKRISLTGKIINNAAEIIFFVSGKSKSKIIDSILHKKDGYLAYPAAHIHPDWGKLIWVMDKDAASK